MFKIRVLKREETERVLTMDKVITAVEDVYRAKSEGDTAVFPLVFHEFEPGAADMDIKSGWLKSDRIWGLKLVSWFGNNIAKGIPALIGTILIMDDKTGAPLGLLDGAHITGMRTGAAGAIGAKLLAREDSEKLLVVGAGHVAHFQIEAMLELFPGLKKVMIYDGLNYETANEMVQHFAEREKGVKFIPVADAEKATGEADIVITVTPSREPVIKHEWVSPGTHFSCIGADMSGKQEIDPLIVKEARIFTDDTRQCLDVGEIELPYKEGLITEENIAGEIGDIMTQKAEGRQSAEQITVFDATGTALLDLMTGMLAIREAEKNDIGQIVEL